MKSLFSNDNQEVLNNIYTGITLPGRNSDGRISESLFVGYNCQKIYVML